jgi:hypothetical protein
VLEYSNKFAVYPNKKEVLCNVPSYLGRRCGEAASFEDEE